MDETTHPVTSGASSDFGKLILRLAVGGMMLLHGIAKIKGGLGGVEDALAAKGLPTAIAYGVYVGEVLAPLLMIAGFLTRPAALLLVINMVAAIGLRHTADVMKLDQYGAWAVEVPMFYLLGALTIMFLGAGRFSLSGGRGKMD